MPDKTILFELKEKAKWSLDMEERKTAIKDLSTYGHNALPQLEEILNITAYEDVKMACIEAIRAIRGSEEEIATDTGSGISTGTTSPTMTAKTHQKKENEKEEESATEPEIRLADLPP